MADGRSSLTRLLLMSSAAMAAMAMAALLSLAAFFFLFFMANVLITAAPFTRKLAIALMGEHLFFPREAALQKLGASTLYRIHFVVYNSFWLVLTVYAFFALRIGIFSMLRQAWQS